MTISAPTKFTVVWGASAGSGYIRSVPTASQIATTPGAASFTDGFVPANFTAVAAGGVPPFGQDMNGVLRSITAWEQYLQAGGPILYDSALSTAIGGYPGGAILISLTMPGTFWFNNAGGNRTDPDGPSPAGWFKFSYDANVLSQASTAANAYTVGYAQPKLGFTPVQQGTGVGQTSNAVKIGYDGTGKLKATVDTSDLGNIALERWANSTFDAAGAATSALSAAEAYTRAYSEPLLSYPPVQQGTGVGQTSNAVKIGWDGSSKLKATVDTSDLGNIALEPWVQSIFSLIQQSGTSAEYILPKGFKIQIGFSGNLNPPGGYSVYSPGGIFFPAAFNSVVLGVICQFVCGSGGPSNSNAVIYTTPNSSFPLAGFVPYLVSGSSQLLASNYAFYYLAIGI